MASLRDYALQIKAQLDQLNTDLAAALQRVQDLRDQKTRAQAELQKIRDYFTAIGDPPV